MSVFVNDGGVEKEAKMIYVNDGGIDKLVAGVGTQPPEIVNVRYFPGGTISTINADIEAGDKALLAFTRGDSSFDELPPGFVEAGRQVVSGVSCITGVLESAVDQSLSIARPRSGTQRLLVIFRGAGDIGFRGGSLVNGSTRTIPAIPGIQEGSIKIVFCTGSVFPTATGFRDGLIVLPGTYNSTLDRFAAMFTAAPIIEDHNRTVSFYNSNDQSVFQVEATPL